MKIFYILIAILMLPIISCEKDSSIVSYNADPDNNSGSNEINIREEISSIVWGKLSGRAVYMKKGKYIYIDTKDSTVRIIGDIFNVRASKVKYNYKKDTITGMVEEEDNNSKFDLMSIDFYGNKSILYESFNMTGKPTLLYDATPVYDWLRDGRLAYIGQNGTVYIDGTPVSSDTTLTYYDISCLPYGNKILLLSSFQDSVKIDFQIVTIDINSGKKSATLLYSIPWLTYYLTSLRYSAVSGQILYSVVTYVFDFSSITAQFDIYIVPYTLIASSASLPNWSPVIEGELAYTKNDNTYLKNISTNEETLVIQGGEMISWFN